MTQAESVIAFVAGYALLAVGLVLALGPWALVALGALTIAAALLLPTREKPSATSETGQQTPGTGW